MEDFSEIIEKDLGNGKVEVKEVLINGKEYKKVFKKERWEKIKKKNEYQFLCGLYSSLFNRNVGYSSRFAMFGFDYCFSLLELDRIYALAIIVEKHITRKARKVIYKTFDKELAGMIYSEVKKGLKNERHWIDTYYSCRRIEIENKGWRWDWQESTKEYERLKEITRQEKKKFATIETYVLHKLKLDDVFSNDFFNKEIENINSLIDSTECKKLKLL